MIMNIDALILSVIVMVLIAGGFVWGYKWGFSRGYKAGLDKQQNPLSPSAITPYTIFERTMQRYECIVRIPSCGVRKERAGLYTQLAVELSEKIARQLLINRVIRPVILDPNAGPDGYAVEIGASIYACSNPTFDQYPRLVFLDPAPLDEDNPLGPQKK